MSKLRSGISVACVISLAAMIGCQVKPPAAPSGSDEATLNRTGGKVGNPATGSGQAQPGGQAGQANPATGGTGATQPGSAIVNPGGTAATTPLAPGEVPKALAQGTPSREAVLAQVPAMAVTAQGGGLYKSADGRLQAVIPPGALSGDTQVKFAALDTSGLQATAIMTPGIIFAMDLGGVALEDGQAIIVKSRVDPRFVEEFQKSAPGKDPASAGLSQEDGVWYLSMPVKAISGPDAENMQTNHVAGDLATVEMQPLPSTYGLKQASPEPSASPTAAPTATPTPAPTPTPTPTPVPKLPTTSSVDAEVNGWDAMTQAQKDAPQHRKIDTMITRALGYDVTMTMKPTRAETLGTADKNEYIHCFVGHGWCASSTVWGTIDGTIKFNNAVTTNHLPPTGLADAVNIHRRPGTGIMDWDCTSAVQLVPVTVKARYTSDDSSVHHQPATDATITRVAGGATFSDGPQASITFQVGLGTTFKVYGSINKPEYSESAKADASGQNGGQTITVDIPKNSPTIALNITSDAKLTSGATLHVEYTLGSEKRTEDLTVPNGTDTFFVGTFKAKVPTDGDHTLTLKRVYGDNFDDDGAPDLNAGFAVHRNKSYAKSIKIKLNAPK